MVLQVMKMSFTQRIGFHNQWTDDRKGSIKGISFLCLEVAKVSLLFLVNPSRACTCAQVHLN